MNNSGIYKRTVRASFDDLNWAPNKTSDSIGAKAGHSFQAYTSEAVIG